MTINTPKSDRPPCPSCGSTHILKNGSTHHKKPKFLCKACRRQFSENQQKKLISSGVKQTIKKLLLERISLVGIARSLGGAISWLQKFVNNLYRSVSCHIQVVSETITDLELECLEIVISRCFKRN